MFRNQPENTTVWQMEVNKLICSCRVYSWRLHLLYVLHNIKIYFYILHLLGIGTSISVGVISLRSLFHVNYDAMILAFGR